MNKTRKFSEIPCNPREVYQFISDECALVYFVKIPKKTQSQRGGKYLSNNDKKGGKHELFNYR